MKKKSPPTSARSTLTTSISELKSICEAIEEISSTTEIPSAEVDRIVSALVPTFDRAVENFQGRVDARISLMDSLDLLGDRLSNEIKHLQGKLQTAKNIKQRVCDNTQMFMEANTDLDFRGAFRRLALINNGGKQGIEYARPLQAIGDIIDPADTHLYADEYIDGVKIFRLKREQFENEIRSGVESSAAVLKPRGQHLRRY